MHLASVVNGVPRKLMSFVGGCLCGAHRYAITRKYLNAMHCYCDMCRKAHGTAFSTHIVVKPEQLRWAEGPTRQRFQSSRKGVREFCGACGTHLLVHGQSGDDTLAIPAGTLDGDPELTLLGHMFTQEQVSWIHINDTLPRHRAWPPGFGPTSSSGEGQP